MDKRPEVIEAARTLFSQFGLKKVTTDDIARDAHISKATIYKYFRNKTEIFDEVVSIEAHELLTAIQTAVDAQPAVVDKFKAHLLTRMQKIKHLANLYRVTQESWGDFWPHLSRMKVWFLEEEKAIIRQIMQHGIDNGELQIERLDLCAHITCATLHTIEFPWALEAHGINSSDYADMMIGMLYHGIRRR
jgi:TetR/AcrR family transcriptional regulator